MADIGIFYGSTTGNTQRVAERIQAGFGSEAADLRPIAEASADEVSSYQYLIFGSSTWGVGDLQDDWFDGMGTLGQLNLSGKTAALFGTGDPQGYPDSFVDAIGLLYDKVTALGAVVVGFWPTEGYTYDSSKAERDGQFVGLVIDEDNQSDLTDERINRWVESLKATMQQE